MSLRYSIFLTLFLGGLLLTQGCGDGPEELVDFNRDVRPILNDNCLACHGGVRKSGGFSLLFEEEALSATESGQPALVPGDPAKSEMIRRLQTDDPEMRMPLDADPLSEEQIAILRRWVEQGASWTPHWSLVAPTRPELPAVEEDNWIRNPVDRFILAGMAETELEPNPEADCADLLRRVYLDLTGLPPAPEEVAAFCGNPSEEAYLAIVDSLLASPHYGERWAAMWLDLARYADSKGYEADRHREIWKYRDWVIDAFNADMPFDRFTVEQLAGDLLPSPGKDQLIATAFHRNTMNNDEGGTDNEEFRVAAVIDRVNTTWEIWQGMTFSCVQCHSHPYDPFRHEDYYRSLAFFNNTEDADRPDEKPVLAVFPKKAEKTARNYEKQLAEGKGRAEAVAIRALLDSLPRSTVPIMRELPPDSSRVTHVFEGGNFMQPGERVEPGLPASMPPMADSLPRDRLGFARWLTDDANPLTARVIVNRFWAKVFGRGLVETVEDFGSQGEEPTHPALLDWLAVTFREDMGWSVKRLLRLIVTSSTYRQSTQVDPAELTFDPHNRFLARAPRPRLSAEMVRDQALQVSGLLSDKMFGPSVMPPQPEGVWQVVYDGKAWETDTGEDKYRRALYTYWRRTSPYPSLVAFDSPSREFCVSRRVPTNTPLQALVTLNDPVYIEAAQALAARMREEAPEPALEEILKYGYQLALLKEPEPETLASLMSLYQDAEKAYGADPEAGRKALTLTANAIMNLDSFLTKS